MLQKRGNNLMGRARSLTGGRSRGEGRQSRGFRKARISAPGRGPGPQGAGLQIRLLLPLLALSVGALTLAGDVYFTADFEGAMPPGADGLAGTRIQMPGHGGVLHVESLPPSPTPPLLRIPLPIEKLRGNRVFFGADVRGENLSERPKAWNGVKVMLVVETPSGTSYPQPEIPVGSFDWARFSALGDIPADATAAMLALGLEEVAGRVWFDNVRVTRQRALTQAPAADPARPIHRGHPLPRLRGAMAGTRLTEADIEHFARAWGGNLLRWQLFEEARQDRPLEQYDAWLETELDYLDGVLGWCRQLGVMLVVDLHSPPGGQAFEAGYITARGDIFRKPEAQAAFVDVWRKIALRYRGQAVIWGFDLLNEPDDSMLAEGCADWQELAGRAARAIRAIDAERTCIIEPNGWGAAPAFVSFQPIGLPNCVYSFHLYAPHAFTHQGIHGNPGGLDYPGSIGGQPWDKAALRQHMEPAVAFAERYRVHLYVGEFSAIRIAPGESAARYLTDATELFEELGFDWSYHAYREWQGWSLEHEGPLDHPQRTTRPSDRERVITHWFGQNRRPDLVE